MEISVNGLIILTTRLERETCLFHIFYYSITFISEFCGGEICLYCKQWNLIHDLSNLNQSVLLFLSLSLRDTKQLLLIFIPEYCN